MKTYVLTALVATGVLTASACSLSSGSKPSGGEEFPSGPVSITVPYAAGGPNDVIARGLAPCLGEQIGDTVIVENKEGGGGAIGTAEVVRSEPDGHTLALVPTTGSLLLLPLLQDVGYSLDDFTPVAETYHAPSALYVKADSRYRNAKDFFQQAQDGQGSVSVGMAGAGTVFDVELKHLAEEYGIGIKAVPFDGGAEAQAALLGGNVDALYALADQGRISTVEAGQLRVLATGSAERTDLLPDTPTFVELGYEDLTASTTSFVLVAPAGLAGDVRTTLADATQDCLSDNAAVRKAIGNSYVPEPPARGEKLENDLRTTQAKLEKLVK